MRYPQISYAPLHRKLLSINLDKNLDACMQLKITLKLKFHLDAKLVNEENVAEGLEWLLQDAQEKDVFLLHICGNSTKFDLIHILDNLPSKVTMFVMWENGTELGLRYKFLDESKGLDKPSKTLHGLYNNDIVWNPQIMETENNKISETCGTSIVLNCGKGLTKMLHFIFSTTNSYTFNFAMLMAKLKSLQACNKFVGNIFIETSKYIDLEVPIGRFLSAPL